VTAAVCISSLSHRYGKVQALDGVDIAIEEGTITGLLGRNGAGKTTLLQVVAGHMQPSEGAVEVFGETPFERASVLTKVCFVRESQRYSSTFRIDHVLRGAATLFPSWDQQVAEELLERFELPRRRKMKDLSRGMRSSVGCLVGLASRAELTLFDEPTAGHDAVARQVFYDALIADLAEHPRTVVLSSHLIDEIAPLVERAIVLHRGSTVLHGDADVLRRLLLTVTGPAELVEAYAADRALVHRDQLGSTVRATLAPGRRPLDAHEASQLGLEVAHPSLQEVIVRATSEGDAAATTRRALAGAATGGEPS
jgi:ABC-2 type transport system ATP-binding protein